MTMLRVLATLATLAAGLFAGAALYITLAEHPARTSLGTPAALAEWRPAYGRGAAMQAPLAVVGALAALAAWWMGAGRGWLTGGLLLGAVVPFTLLVVRATNVALQDPALDPASARATELLALWGRLHAVRTVASLAAFGLFLVGLARRP